MKEFVRTLNQTFRVHYKEALMYVIVTAGGGILGILIVTGVVFFAGTEEGYAKLGATLALLFGAIFVFFGSLFSVQTEFNLAISMGKTRKYFVPARYLELALDILVMLAVTTLINGLEGILYPALFPGATCEFGMDAIVYNVGAMIGITVGAPVLILLLGVLLMRFSTKMFWGLWALWMIAFVGGPRILSAVKKNPDSLPGRIGMRVMEFCSGITAVELAVSMILLAVVGMIATVMLFRKQRVIA